jgi:hypothetical protein
MGAEVRLRAGHGRERRAHREPRPRAVVISDPRVLRALSKLTSISASFRAAMTCVWQHGGGPAGVVYMSLAFSIKLKK